MCNSGLYRISEKKYFVLPVVFSFWVDFSDGSSLRVSSFFCVSFLFSRCFLHNPSPPFIMEFFWVSQVPLFCSFANRACSVPVALVSPFAVFSHSFLLLVLIPSKASGRSSSLGRAEVCPSRYPHFWRIPLFPFFPIWAESCSAIFESHSLLFFLPCPGSPRPFCCLCHERSFCASCFFLLFLSSFYRSVSVFLFICA